MRRFLLIAAVFAVVLLYGLTVATGSSNVLSDYFWWIVALCGLLLLVLAAVLVRYVVLLMRDNSKSVFGSQIARRLSGMFTLVAVLPGVFLFGISAQFINGTINSWFGNDTHEALERSLNLSKSALNLAVDNAVSNATPVQIDLISAASLDGDLGQTLAQSAPTSEFAQLALYNATTHKVEKSINPLKLNQPTLNKEGWVFTGVHLADNGADDPCQNQDGNGTAHRDDVTVALQILFTSGGDVYFQWGFIQVTSEGIINAVFIFLRFVLIISFSTLLTLTTAPLQLTDAIEAVMKPLAVVKFPVHEVALMLSIALRFVPTLMDEAQKIMNAQRARGVDFGEGNLFEQMKAIIPILIPLFVSSLNRAEDLATAMEARGYQGGDGRSKYRVLNYEMRDAIAGLSLVAVTILLFVLKA